MVAKDAQQRYKGIAAGTSSGLSMIGSLYILGRYWYARRVKARESVHHIDVTKELIHVLAWLDLVGAVGRCFGVLPTQTYDQSKGEPVTSVCQLQAFVITFGDVSPIAWNFLMAYNLFRWVCLGEDQQMLQRRIKWYICGTLVFTLTIDLFALGFDAFGAAGQWCWVVFPGHRTKELCWKLITLYAWVLLGAISMAVLLVLVKLNVQKRLKGVDNDDARVAYHGVVQNLTIYIVAFIVCWSPAVLDRGYYAIMGHEIFTLSMLHTSIVPLQGFVNAVIYGKFHVWVGRHLHSTPPDPRSSDKSLKSSSDPLRERDLQQSERRQFGTAMIFVTSFDMNWNPFPPNLNDWIPPDKDLYVFSLQHCLDVQTVEQAIRKHLLQINYPMGYRSITSLAGSVLRGHSQDASLCQIVFVNNSDIASGNFQFRTSDGRAWSQRKVFKGVVGIPMRYFEASLAFVSCNLDPVSGNSQAAHPVIPLAAKHAATLSLVGSFEMSADRASVDFPYLYHHTILSGNLGYSIDMPRSELTTSIDQAYKSECLKRATDAALDVKLRHFGQSPLDTVKTPTAISPCTSGLHEPANSNVPVQWNLLYFKTRGSLGRASYSSNSSGDDDSEYEEVFKADYDGLPFTELRSPVRGGDRTSFVPVSRPSGSCDEVQVDIGVSGIEPEASETPVDSQQAWLRFLNSLFPAASPQRAVQSTVEDDRSSRKPRLDALSLQRVDSKKISDWTAKSHLVAQSCKQKWQDVLRHDELRAAIEAKEILCGFEEPPITFLPSYPRQVGAAASYSKLAQKSCKNLFAEASEHLPAYKDRILLHSLPDTRQRIRNVGYWLCEEILTSTHKPVCSVYELEIDRFFSYKNTEADVSDMKAGKLALKDKSHIQEYKIKLVNLDANIWTYAQRNSAPTLLWRSRGPTPDTQPSSGGDQTSVQSIPEEETSSEHQQSPELHSVGSFSNVLGRMKRKSLQRSTGPSTHSTSGSRGSTSRRGRLDSMNGELFDLVPVDPTSIATIFPLPSEDVYALQRKVYEVAHSVQNGFHSSARDEEGEEASLAYTNFRSVSWKEALSRGVMHSAITKAVNGAIHVAIKIEGDTKSQGGQGILCIQERDLIEHAAPVITEAAPIPFDVPLTWGGKHVGYLHGDILCGL